MIINDGLVYHVVINQSARSLIFCVIPLVKQACIHKYYIRYLGTYSLLPNKYRGAIIYNIRISFGNYHTSDSTSFESPDQGPFAVCLVKGVPALLFISAQSTHTILLINLIAKSLLVDCGQDHLFYRAIK